METRFENGASIIKIPLSERQKNKYGVKGSYVTGKTMKVSIIIDKKRYHLGSYKTQEEAKSIREEAEKRKHDGSFFQWYESLHGQTNKYGVLGLSRRKSDGLYVLKIIQKGKTYNVGIFKNIDEAAAIRKEADAHISQGTFEEWIDLYKKKSK